MAAPKQTDPQYKLRMTPEIKEQIEKAAKANNRTMNAEILARLENSFVKKVSEISAEELAENTRALTEVISVLKKDVRSDIFAMRMLLEIIVMNDGKADERTLRLARKLISGSRFRADDEEPEKDEE